MDDRPTDEEILRQEQAIRAAEVDTQPFVGPRLPLSHLLGEFSGHPVYERKVTVKDSLLTR